MKEQVFNILKLIAPSFYRKAPENNTAYPCIVFYEILNEPLYRGDNTFSKSRHYVYNVEVYTNDGIDELAEQIEEAIREIKGTLHNQSDISDDDMLGYRFEFEIKEIK